MSWLNAIVVFFKAIIEGVKAAGSMMLVKLKKL